jgi:uncharacterized lipoprotein YbaY
MCMKKQLTVILITMSIFLAGCGSSHEAALTGVITHPHYMTLPVGTVMTVQIVETTQDGSGRKIAEQVIQDQEIGIPRPFIVVYEQGKINQQQAYSISVRIEDSTGKLIYTSEKEIPVITYGNPTKDIDISVVLVNG